MTTYLLLIISTVQSAKVLKRAVAAYQFLTVPNCQHQTIQLQNMSGHQPSIMSTNTQVSNSSLTWVEWNHEKNLMGITIVKVNWYLLLALSHHQEPHTFSSIQFNSISLLQQTTDLAKLQKPFLPNLTGWSINSWTALMTLGPDSVSHPHAERDYNC